MQARWNPPIHIELLPRGCVFTRVFTRTRNFCKFCRIFIPVPGTSVSSARQCHKYPGYGYSIFITARNCCKFCTSVPQYSKVLQDFHTRNRNFRMLCISFIPVPGISVSSVRPVSQYPGYGYSMFCTRPELL